jgi:hypothetical protein
VADVKWYLRAASKGLRQTDLEQVADNGHEGAAERDIAVELVNVAKASRDNLGGE